MPTKNLRVHMGMFLWNSFQNEFQTESCEISFACLHSSFVSCSSESVFSLGEKKQNQKTLKKQPHVVKPWPCSHLWKEKESLSCLIPPVPRAPPQNSWVTNGTGPNKAGGTAKILKNTRYR